jgi:hypothetical protein
MVTNSWMGTCGAGRDTCVMYPVWAVQYTILDLCQLGSGPLTLAQHIVCVRSAQSISMLSITITTALFVYAIKAACETNAWGLPLFRCS